MLPVVVFEGPLEDSGADCIEARPPGPTARGTGPAPSTRREVLLMGAAPHCVLRAGGR